MMQDETRVEVVQGLTQPWADFHGDLPDYDHPLRCVFESGVQYTVELLAKELKVTDWTPCDGTEEYDGDLGGTLMNIVLAAMPKDQHGDPVHPRDLPLAFAAPPAGERVKHAWDAGYSTGQTYANDPPFAGLGKHNRQHGWELYACSLTDRNLVAHPLPADREAIARIMYERFVEENGGFFNEKNGCGFGTWDELSDKSIWLSAAGFVLALWPTPSAGRDGSGSTVPIAMIIPSLEGARATLQHFAETLADSEPRKLPLAAAFAASEASRLAAAIMLLSPPSTEKGEK